MRVVLLVNRINITAVHHYVLYKFILNYPSQSVWCMQ